MRTHVSRMLSLGAVLLCLPAALAVARPAGADPVPKVAPPKAAPPQAAQPKATAYRYSKRDLAAYYKPTRIHGVDWYSRIGAARLKNERIRAAAGEKRLILQMRALGAFDGST